MVASVEAAQAVLSKEAQDNLAAAKVLESAAGNPSMLPAILSLLSACSEQRREEVALLEEVQQQLESDGTRPVQPLSSIVRMLVRNGALTESLEIDGQPYKGTIEEAFEDDSVSDEATSLIYESITDAGRIALRELSPASRASALFESDAKFFEGFVATLEICASDSGVSTKDLEQALDARGLLYRDSKNNIPTIYPSMYANKLKDAGCIAWKHAWITTDVGRKVLSTYGSSGHTPVE